MKGPYAWPLLIDPYPKTIAYSTILNKSVFTLQRLLRIKDGFHNNYQKHRLRYLMGSYDSLIRMDEPFKISLSFSHTHTNEQIASGINGSKLCDYWAIMHIIENSTFSAK